MKRVPLKWHFDGNNLYEPRHIQTCTPFPWTNPYDLGLGELILADIVRFYQPKWDICMYIYCIYIYIYVYTVYNIHMLDMVLPTTIGVNLSHCWASIKGSSASNCTKCCPKVALTSTAMRSGHHGLGPSGEHALQHCNMCLDEVWSPQTTFTQWWSPWTLQKNRTWPTLRHHSAPPGFLQLATPEDVVMFIGAVFKTLYW